MADMIVLAMHGAPPRDFPRMEMAELFDLQGRVEHARVPLPAETIARYEELHARMRNWPRTPQNDPFFTASYELAASLEAALGIPVHVGFNEFCAPDLDAAVAAAVAQGATRVVVVTPMMTRGGDHAEEDIPAALQRAGAQHPGVEIVYAWPFETVAVARFLADQVATRLK
jgi:sirohydrochlorin cobaltochelatase